jgi:hypothetical protein
LRTILYLSKPENHISIETGHVNEPFLITWDSAFYEFRKALKNYPGYSYWYIYSPLKFVDRLSVDIPEMLTPVTWHTDPTPGFGSSKLIA